MLNYLRENVRNLLIIGAFTDRSTGGVHSIGPTAHRLVQEALVSVLLVKGNRPVYMRAPICTSVEDENVVTIAPQLAEVRHERMYTNDLLQEQVHFGAR